MHLLKYSCIFKLWKLPSLYYTDLQLKLMSPSIILCRLNIAKESFIRLFHIYYIRKKVCEMQRKEAKYKRQSRSCIILCVKLAVRRCRFKLLLHNLRPEVDDLQRKMAYFRMISGIYAKKTRGRGK